jgi:phytol kinase
MNDFLGLTLSYAFILASMAAASLLLRFRIVDGAGARKVIHIAVGHWWFIAMFTIASPAVVVIGPASFIIINYLIDRFRLLPAMASEGSNLGTVYYPISLLVLVLVCWAWGMPKWIGALGVMIMAWGDGLAAIFGKLSSAGGRLKVFGNEKSLAGSTAMLIVSFAVALLIRLIFDPSASFAAAALAAGAVSLLATAIELGTPFGLDNISVPLVSSAVYWLTLAG